MKRFCILGSSSQTYPDMRAKELKVTPCVPRVPPSNQRRFSNSSRALNPTPANWIPAAAGQDACSRAWRAGLEKVQIPQLQPDADAERYVEYAGEASKEVPRRNLMRAQSKLGG